MMESFKDPGNLILAIAIFIAIAGIIILIWVLTYSKKYHRKAVLLKNVGDRLSELANNKEGIITLAHEIGILDETNTFQLRPELLQAEARALGKIVGIVLQLIPANKYKIYAKQFEEFSALYRDPIQARRFLEGIDVSLGPPGKPLTENAWKNVSRKTAVASAQ